MGTRSASKAPQDIGTTHDPNQKLVPNMFQATRSDPCQPMPNVLPDAAGGRTLLVKPGGSLDKPLLGLGGQTQTFRNKPVPQKVEPAVNSTNERLLGFFSSSITRIVFTLNDTP